MMVKTCCASYCRNRSKKPGISFFCFPKAPHLRREWIRRINKVNFQPTRHTVLCSEHFQSDSFLSESVPEFLQLIGLEQRPIRRRLKCGALPTLFKRTRNGWEEGEGVREAGKGQAEEETGKEEDSDDEPRFVIQMDIAEEDQESEQQAIAASQGISLKKSDDDEILRAEDLNGRSPRPRRSCRNRGTADELHRDSQDMVKKSCDLNDDAESDRRNPTKEEDYIIHALEKENASNADPEKDQAEDVPCQEGSLFTIESVRTVNDNDAELNREGIPDGFGPDSPEECDTTSPPAKRLKHARKRSSQEAEGAVQNLGLPGAPPENSGPILCRIDPAFCKFQPVFQVPFTSSHVFFSKTASTKFTNSPIHSTCSATAADNKTNAINNLKVLPSDSGNGDALPDTSHPKTAAPTGGEDPDLAAKVAPSATTDSTPLVMFPLCTLPCCNGRKSENVVGPKPVHIKQEVADPEDFSPLPGQASIRSPVFPQQGFSLSLPRSRPSSVPYRSDPVSIPRGGEAKAMIPYRSEPVKKFPSTPMSVRAPVDYRDKARKNLTHDILPQKLDRMLRSRVHSCSGGTQEPAGTGDQGGPSRGRSPRLARQPLSDKATAASVSTSSLKSSGADSASTHLGKIAHSFQSPINLSLQAADVGHGPTSSMAMGPFFLRRDHILEDLLDVFKHSAERIHRGIVFRLCRNVASSPSAATGARPPQQQQDNWEDVPFKQLFSMFWVECMNVYFVGNEQKVLRIDAQKTSSDLPYILGKILRHGLVLCGYWPVALATACAVAIFTGEKCSKELFLHSLRKTMYVYEAEALEELRESAKGDEDRFKDIRRDWRVGAVLQLYGGAHCKVPNRPDEVEAFVVELAAYYLYCQPFWWLRELRRGLLALTEHTKQDQNYLTSMTEREVVEMYLTLEPTPQALLQRTIFCMEDSKQVSQNRVKGFLECCLLRLSRQDLGHLLRLWSYADCLLDDSYRVTFSSSATGANGGAPPLFRPSQNTLILGHTSPSFELFYAMFRRLLEDESSKP